jgi:colanic acid biosynthesis glycosyl transferase WcaI
LARWLQTRANHEIQVLTGFPNYPGGRLYDGYRLSVAYRERMHGVEVLRVPLYANHDASAVRRIANYGSFALSASTIGAALCGSADVGFVYHPPATVGLPAMVLKATRGMPFVYHIADMWPESVVDSGMIRSPRAKALIGRALTSWCKLVYEQAAAITVISPGFKSLLIERGVAPDKVEVVYNWCDEDLFRRRPRDEALAERHGFSGKFNIVFAGGFGAFQGLETVLDAADLVRAVQSIQIVLVGSGQDEARLKAYAASKRLNNVLFLGRRPLSEMPAINDLADVLLVHLRDLPFFAATVPSKTQVALAAGRPVLMAVRGDAATIVRCAKAGLTCPPEDPRALADAMVRMSNASIEELEQMGRNGRSYYDSHMSLEVGGAQMDLLLRKVAGDG